MKKNMVSMNLLEIVTHSRVCAYLCCAVTHNYSSLCAKVQNGDPNPASLIT